MSNSIFIELVEFSRITPGKYFKLPDVTYCGYTVECPTETFVEDSYGAISFIESDLNEYGGTPLDQVVQLVLSSWNTHMVRLISECYKRKCDIYINGIEYTPSDTVIKLLERSYV